MSNSQRSIDVAAQFSAYPAGRDDDDGPNNGAKFRREHLIPMLEAAIDANETLLVSLDGVKSFGSSFLEEAFGGLVRAGFSKQKLREHLKVASGKASSARYLDAVNRYIDQA